MVTKPEPQGHGHAVAGFVAGGRVIEIHGRAATGRKQNGLGVDEAIAARAHVDEQRADDRGAVRRWDQSDRPMLLELGHARRPDFFHQAIDDLDAG